MCFRFPFPRGHGDSSRVQHLPKQLGMVCHHLSGHLVCFQIQCSVSRRSKVEERLLTLSAIVKQVTRVGGNYYDTLFTELMLSLKITVADEV